MRYSQNSCGLLSCDVSPLTMDTVKQSIARATAKRIISIIFILLTSYIIHLNLPFFMITVISAIRDDDVVEEVDAHQTTGVLDRTGEVVIHIAGFQAA